jgi:hypothetical protein
MATNEARSELLEAAAEAPAADAATMAITLRNPGVPVTLDTLAAALSGQAVEIIEARAAIIDTARRRAIRMTHPEDWVLHKSPDGRITGYLQDSGCDRVRDIWGIEVFNVSQPQKVALAAGAAFMYLLSADGRSRLTMATVEGVEGGRPSDDPICKGKSGAELELLVRKSARANLDGRITRALTGLENVPIAELEAAWEGTPKQTQFCRAGHGFGTQDQRFGGAREGTPDIEPPQCTVCAPVNGQRVKLQYRPAKDGRQAFYGCPNYTQHPQQKVIENAADWIAGAPARAAAAAKAAQMKDKPESGANG